MMDCHAELPFAASSVPPTPHPAIADLKNYPQNIGIIDTSGWPSKETEFYGNHDTPLWMSWKGAGLQVVAGLGRRIE